MADAPDIDQSYFERTVGAANVARYFDENGSGAADATLVEEALLIGTQVCRDKLFPGFSSATVDSLRSNQHYARTVAWVSLYQRIMTKGEWMLPDGSFPYERQVMMFEKELLNIARGTERMTIEATTPNPVKLARSSPSGSVDRDLDFAPSKDHPTGRGGF